MRLLILTRKEVATLTVLFLGIFGVLMYWHDFAPTQAFKYPPSLYFLSYGLFVSFLLYYLLNIEPIKNMLNHKFVLFISKVSLWLYFWYIIPIFIIRFFGESMPLIVNNFVTRFLFLFIVGLGLTYAQEQLSLKYRDIKIKITHRSKGVTKSPILEGEQKKY
jgi:hypothetical protein